MQSGYIVIFILLITIFILRKRTEESVLIHKIISKKAEGNLYMKSLAKKFIGKDCIIYTFNAQITGVITEVGEGALLIEENNSTEAVNLDFIVRIKEHPVGKNGKRKIIY